MRIGAEGGKDYAGKGCVGCREGEELATWKGGEDLGRDICRAAVGAFCADVHAADSEGGSEASGGRSGVRLAVLVVSGEQGIVQRVEMGDACPQVFGRQDIKAFEYEYKYV